MGRKLQIEWQENAKTLEGLYKAETDIQKRTRLHGLWLVRSGRPIKEAAEVVGVHERTVHKWLSWYRSGGLTEVISKRIGGHSPVQPWLNQEQQDALRAKADAGDFRAIAQAVDWVAKTYGIKYTYWGMRSLFQRMKLKQKVPRPSNPKASAAVQEAWKKGGSPMP